MKNLETIRIQAGDICIAFVSDDSGVLAWLRSIYSEFICDLPANITVEVVATETMEPDEISRRLCNSRLTHQDGIFSFEDGLVSGTYDLESMRVRLRLERQLLEQNSAGYYLNQFMCLLYGSALPNDSRSGIVHSSAVVIDGCAFLFTGPSGIGKTTAAKLCRDAGNAIVINDEGNLLVAEPASRDGLTVQGIPIIGKLPEKNNLGAPLMAVLFLKQGNHTEITPLDKASAMKRLLYQVVGNQSFGQGKSGVVALKFAFSDVIARSVPCFELEFTLEGSELHNRLLELRKKLIKEQEVYAG